MPHCRDQTVGLAAFKAKMRDLLDLVSLEVVPTHLSDVDADLDLDGEHPVLLLDIETSEERKDEVLWEALALIIRGPDHAGSAQPVRHLRLVSGAG